MNPLTNMKNVKKLSEQELHTGFKTSWHDQYRNSAWIFVGGLPYDLTEGDIICIFSQYGEIVNINLIRDKDSGKSKGFCFICFEDQRSTDLAVDNFNGINILKRIIRVDHVTDYKMPKDGKKTDETTKKLHEEGCAPKAVPLLAQRIKEEPPDQLRETLADQIQPEMKLPPRLPIFAIKQEKMDEEVKVKKEKKEKKEKKKDKKRKKKKRTKRKSESSSLSDESESEEETEKKRSHIKKKKDRDREESSQRRDYTKNYKKKDNNSKKACLEDSSGSSSGRDTFRQQFRNRSPEHYKHRRSRSRSEERKKYRSRSRSSSNDKSKRKYRRSASPERNKKQKNKSHKHR